MKKRASKLNPMIIDSSRLTLEILRAFRGKRTQRRLSALLGYSFNQVGRWESGKIGIGWSDFLNVAQKCGIDVPIAFRSVFGARLTPLSGAQIFQHFGARTNIAQLTQSLGISRYQLYRFKNGQTETPAELIFLLMHQAGTQLYFFLERLLGNKNAPYLQEIIDFHRRESRLYTKHLFTPLILSALDLADYAALPAHSTPWVANKIGVATASVAAAIQDLQQLGLVRLEGKHLRTALEMISPDYSKDDLRKFLLFWNRLEKDFLERIYPATGNRVGYQIFNLSQADYSLLEKKYLEFYADVASIVSKSQRSGRTDRIYLMKVALLDLSKNTPD